MKAAAASTIIDTETLPACSDSVGSRTAASVYFVAAGAALGILFMKSEVLSWYRIQEMFRFQGFHMFGMIAGAVAVAMTGLQVIRHLAFAPGPASRSSSRA